MISILLSLSSRNDADWLIENIKNEEIKELAKEYLIFDIKEDEDGIKIDGSFLADYVSVSEEDYMAIKDYNKKMIQATKEA